MQVQFAQQNCASLLEAANDFGILRRDAVAILVAGSGRSHACGVEEIFERNRNSVQRSAIITGCDLGFGARCGVKSLLGLSR